jgi:DNA-binding MarR family transcriptional regulator
MPQSDSTEPQKKVPEALKDSLHFVLGVVCEQVEDAVTKHLAQLGLVPRLYAALCVLSQDGPKNQLELGGLVGVNRNAMVQVCDQLEHLQLATREVNPQNRREHVIQITDHGRKTLSQAKRVVKAAHVACTKDLSDRERDQLNNLLLRVSCNP